MAQVQWKVTASSNINQDLCLHSKYCKCLYADDGAFIFSSKQEMTKGLDLVYKHFTRLGIDMHIGRGEVSSKTEHVFFSRPQFFSKDDSFLKWSAELESYSDEQDGALSAVEYQNYESEKARVAQEDMAYDNLEETRNIEVADGSVSFTRHLKYLGSYIYIS